jgi:ATP-dependent Clp protease ATP-binding subunit ClpA
MFERFTEPARQVVVLAQAEARAMAHGWIGTEHLLLGVLADREGIGARVLAGFGLDLDGGRARVVDLLGPGELDPDALAALGIDLDAVRSRVEATFGPGALERPPSRRRCRRGWQSSHMCFTPRAKRALELALKAARERRDSFIGTEHVLLGLLLEGEGLAARLLRDAGVGLGAARAAIDDETRLAG